MLSELGASPSSNSGLVSSSTEPHLKLVIASVHLCNERRNGSERGLAQCTATWVAGALRQPQGALTSARADALYRKSANRTDFTANVEPSSVDLVFGVTVLKFSLSAVGEVGDLVILSRPSDGQVSLQGFCACLLLMC